MKKLILSLILSALAWVAFPQGSPQAINYQAVARDLTGEPVSNRPIAVQFSIRTGNANGAVVYREEHFTTTNLLGLFHAQIGRGIVVSGDFTTINWGAVPHFISIEIDYNGGGAYQLLGAYELISVPYALYAETAGNTGNDLDEQQLSYANDTLYLTNGGWVYLPGGSDDQSLVLSNDTLFITNGGGFVYLGDYIDDADSDPSNEIQDLSLTGNILIVTNNTTATQIDLAPYLDNTDAQQLSFSNDTLYLTNGGSVYLPPATTANAQNLNLSNDTLTITGNPAATDIYLGTYLDNTDNQTLSYDPATGILSISGPAASTVTITLPTGDDWGTQTAATAGAITGDGTTANPIALGQQGATTGQVLVWNGTGWAPANDAVNDNDSDPANEIQDLSYDPLTQTLTITNNSTATAISLAALLDNTDSQNLSFDPATGDLTISGGTGVTLPISSGGDNWGTQTAATNATLSGNGASSNPLGLAQQGATTGQVLVWNGTTWAPANDAVNDADSDPLNEIQDLNLTGNILTITNNGTPTQIDLSPYLDNTDDQTLSYDPLTGVLTISGASGSSVNLPLVAGDDWGAQTAATTGAISGDGTTANPIALGQQGATTGQILVWNGTNWAPAADQVDDADSDPTNEIQNLSLSNDSIRISNGVGVDLSSFLDNTDDQTLTYDPLTGLLIISGPSGSSVTLPTPDNWGTQVVVPIYPLSGQGTMALPLSLAPGTALNQIWKWNGGAWVLAADAVNDADANPTNEIQDLSYNPATQELTITNNAGASVISLSALLDNTDSQTLSFDPLLNELSISGGNAIPLPAPTGDDWGTQTAATQGPITGDGTAGSPIALQAGAAAGQVLVWNGTNWAPATDQVDDADNDPANEIQTLTYDPATGNLTISGTGGNTVTLPIPTGDNWGTTTAATTGAITGNGTAFSPINLAPGSAANQVWRWNGTAWVLVVDNDSDPTNEIQTLSYNPATQDLTLTGQLVPVDLSTLMDDWGTQTAATSGLITGNGVAPDAIRLADGSAAGQIMKWNGTAWVLATDDVNDLDFNPTNEIQDLNLTGNILTITNNAGATPIDLSSYVDIDNQTLGYNPATGVLSITGPANSTVILGANTTAPIIGNGTTIPIAIAPGTSDGDILEWDAVSSTWQIVPNPAGGGTLDDAYRFDLPNFSQQIVADQGPVIIRNPGGLIVTSNTSPNNSFVALQTGNLMYFNPTDGAFRAGRLFSAGLWTGPNVGAFSFAVNHDTRASGANSFAAGLETEAIGPQSTAFGNESYSSGTNSFAIGDTTIASGANSFSSGLSTRATNQQAAAFGAATTANGQNSFASGFGTEASGLNSAAFGNSTIASGASSFAIGNTNTAAGANSFTAGSTNFSNQASSMTFGEGLVVNNRGGVVVGHFNSHINFPTGVTLLTGSPSAPVFLVGNGTTNLFRSNALAVLRNGNVGINTDQPIQRLSVNGNIRMEYLPTGITHGLLYLSDNIFLHASGSISNTFVGNQAGNPGLVLNNGNNVGIGNQALQSISAGTQNTAIGSNALSSIVNGNLNIGIGLNAASTRTGSFQLIAIGDYALDGSGGTADGSVGVGTDALRYSTGNQNTALGFRAGYIAPSTGLSGANNIFIGHLASTASTTIFNSIAIGYQAQANGSNSVAIGNGAIVPASDMIRLGNGSVGVIEGQVAFTTVSDRKFKTNIQNSDLGLDFVMRLRPVTYSMVEGHEGILYTGLIAQELEQVVDDMGVEFSGLKRPANESDHYGVSYATLTIPLIKAVQEQQAEIDALRAENAALRRQVDYIMTVIEGRDE